MNWFMNKYYSETDFANLIKSREFNICAILLNMFCGVSEYNTLFVLWTDFIVYYRHVWWSEAICCICSCVNMIDASKINACAKGDKWIDTIERFQWYNYEVYNIDLKWIKTEIQII